MTPAEIHAFNKGVAAVLAIATSASETLTRDPRHIPISFAQAALAELAEAGKALLLPIDPENPQGSANA